MKKIRSYLSKIKKYWKNSNKAFKKINSEKIDKRLDALESSIDKQNKDIRDRIQRNAESLSSDINKGFKQIPIGTIENFKDNWNYFKGEFFHKDLDLLKQIPRADRLVLSCIRGEIDFEYYSSENKTMYFSTREGVTLSTDFYYGIMLQVFAEKTYLFPPFIEINDYTVFDAGMNRGYSTLWFAQDNRCRNAYGFEIDKDTYNYAVSNFNLNPHLKEKLKAYDFGWSNKDEEIELTYIPGQDSVASISNDFIDNYYSENRKDAAKKKKAKVRRASSVIKEILERDNIKGPLVLKIDVEGAEYDIFDDLIKSDMLSKFTIIFGECHSGMDRIHKQLEGFKLVNETKITDDLSEFCFIKTE